MPTLIWLSNRCRAVGLVLFFYMVFQTSWTVFGIANLVILLASSFCFKDVPLFAIPVYSVAIDTIACVQYGLPWMQTVFAGLLWNAKWILLTAAFELIIAAYRKCYINEVRSENSNNRC